jgi:hypothetical protein
MQIKKSAANKHSRGPLSRMTSQSFVLHAQMSCAHKFLYFRLHFMEWLQGVNLSDGAAKSGEKICIFQHPFGNLTNRLIN